MKRSAAIAPYCLVGIVLLTGCSSEGDGQPATVSVSGVITLDKKPLEGAEVNFFSSNGDFLSSGLTDKDGKYQLYQGAVPGENKVWISKDTSKSDTNPEGGDPAENPDADVAQVEARPGAEEENSEALGEQLPPKFSDPEQTVLKYKVPGGGSDAANFDLTKE